jgi:aspartate ammonia-lyase
VKLDPNVITNAARRIGIEPKELEAILQRGASVSYRAGDYIFHESSPRQWLGLVLAGEIDLIHGQHGQSVLIGVAQPGAVLGEGVMLDDLAHTTSAVTHQGA